MALAGISSKCRGDGDWKRRLDELREAVVRDAEDLARVLKRSGDFERELRATLDEGGSDLE